MKKRLAILGVLATLGAGVYRKSQPAVSADAPVKTEAAAKAAMAEVKRIREEELSQDIVRKLNDGTATEAEREQVRKAFERKNALAERWLEYQLARAREKVSAMEEDHARNLADLRETFNDLGVNDEE